MQAVLSVTLSRLHRVLGDFHEHRGANLFTTFLDFYPCSTGTKFAYFNLFVYEQTRSP